MSDPEFEAAYGQANERLLHAGKPGSVLVRLDIDADGRVVSSRAVDSPVIARLEKFELVLIDDRTGERLPDPPPPTRDSETRQLAAEIARLLRFTPATRRGRPVPQRGVRTTISFG